jgi:hypothetical protein
MSTETQLPKDYIFPNICEMIMMNLKYYEDNPAAVQNLVDIVENGKRNIASMRKLLAEVESENAS